MDIEYQLDPSVHSVFRQLSSSSNTGKPTGSLTVGKQDSLGNQPAVHHRPSSSTFLQSFETENSPVMVPASVDAPSTNSPPSRAPAVGIPGYHPTTTLDLQDTLNKIQVSLQQHQLTPHQPPVVVINNLPPTNSGGWAVEPDHAIIGGAVVTIILAITCGFLWWLRKYRPEAWRSLRIHTIRVLRFLALPASWLCGKAAGFLRSFHQDTQVGNFNNTNLFYLYLLHTC